MQGVSGGKSLWIYLITMSHANKLSDRVTFPLSVADCLENEVTSGYVLQEKRIFLESVGKGVGRAMDHES